MRSHRFINSLVVFGNPAHDERKHGLKKTIEGFRHSFVLFLDKRSISQVIQFTQVVKMKIVSSYHSIQI